MKWFLVGSGMGWSNRKLVRGREIQDVMTYRWAPNNISSNKTGYGPGEILLSVPDYVVPTASLQ